MSARVYSRARVAPSMQAQFPTLPEPAASTRCDHCCWTWHQDAMRLKIINAACAVHGRYLETP